MKISLLLMTAPGENGLKKEMDFQGSVLPCVGDYAFFGPEFWAFAKVEVRFCDLEKDEWTFTLSPQDSRIFNLLRLQGGWKECKL